MNDKLERMFRIVARTGALAALGLGIAVLLGWALNVPALKSVLPGLVTMRANTALAFVLAGTALWLQIDGRKGRSLASLAAGALAVIGILTLLEYATGMDLHIDGILFVDPVPGGANFFPGRMAGTTALCMSFLGVAFLGISAERAWVRNASQVMALAVLGIGFVALLGYAYDVSALYSVSGFAQMAIHTAAGSVVVATGALAAHPATGFMRILSQANLSSASARRFILFAIAVPPTVGFLRLLGQHAGYYGTEFGLALMVMATVFLLAGVVVWNGHVQGAAEGERDRLLETIRRERASLADQVAARTAELTESNASLRESGHRLQIVMNSVPGIVFRRKIAPGGSPSYTFFGGRLLDQWKLTGEDVIRDPSLFLRHLHPDDLPLLQATLNPERDDLQPRSILHRFYRPDGTLHWLQIESRAERLESGTIVRDGIALDVTERLLAESKLKDSERRYRLLAESISDQILHIAPDNSILYSSPSSANISGYSDAERQDHPALELVHPDDAAECVAAIHQSREGNAEISVTYRLRHKSGRWVWVESKIRPFGPVDVQGGQELIVVVRNIDGRRALEEQLRQSQRMEAVGQLTGGVAHEFNNLLMVISGNMEFLEGHLDGSTDATELLSTMRRAVRRGAALTQDLLAFSRKQPLRPAALDVGSVLTDFGRLARGVLPESIDVNFERGDGDLLATADVNQLQNVILNLVVNARDAMPGGGKIVVRMQAVDIAEPEARAVDAEPGRYVEISVKDSGTGMTPDVLAHAVEPFFSTKEVGKGTGLGLSMVHGFSRQSGGFLAIDTAVGRGTTVRVCLPAAPGDQELPAAAGEAGVASPPQAWKRAVLVVEDNPDLLRSVERMVREIGYQVITAADGPAALDIIRGHQQIDILLTDVVMPNGLSGLDVARLARTRFPDIRIVYMSGYNENVIIHYGAVDPGVVLLSKPFHKDELERTLGEVVAQPHSDGVGKAQS